MAPDEAAAALLPGQPLPTQPGADDSPLDTPGDLQGGSNMCHCHVSHYICLPVIVTVAACGCNSFCTDGACMQRLPSIGSRACRRGDIICDKVAMPRVSGEHLCSAADPAPIVEPASAQLGAGAVPEAGLGTGGLSPLAVDTPGIPPAPAAATALPPLEHDLIAGTFLLWPLASCHAKAAPDCILHVQLNISCTKLQITTATHAPAGSNTTMHMRARPHYRTNNATSYSASG